jgi:biopolymer transport protein ExbD
MAFNDPQEDVMNEINMTPLIDVMLVLLIVFMVTLPAMTNAVKLDLPSATSTPVDNVPPHIAVAIQRDGAVHWDNEAVDAAQLHVKLAAAAQREPQPDIQIYADKEVRYEAVAEVLTATQRAGLTKIDFVTQPQTN